MDGALIEIHSLTVRYQPKTATSVFAVEGVELRIAPGEVVGVLGESGSGKSTLAAAIMHVLPATAERHGQVLFEHRDLTAMDESDLQRVRGKSISWIRQDPANSLNPVIRVGAQISEVLRAHLQLNRGERKKRVEELLLEVGFDDPERIASSYAHQLSGGQRQRIAIAQAIACHPALVIADEATSKLDAPLQMQIQSLMSAIVRRHGTALVWITHDPAALGGFADRVVVMSSGQIVEQGETDHILGRPDHPYTQQLVRLAQELSLGPFRGTGYSKYAD